MLGIPLEVIVILSCSLQLPEEHQDPFVLDQDNYMIQESSENKSCFKWQIIRLGIIPEVIVILSCHLQLQEEHQDPYIPDQDKYIIEECSEDKSCFKWSVIMLGIIMDVIVILSCPLQLQEEHQDPFIPDKDIYMIHESRIWSIWSNFVFWPFMYHVVILVRNSGVLMLFLEL